MKNAIRPTRYLMILGILLLVLTCQCGEEDSIIGDGVGPEGGCFVGCVGDEENYYKCNVFSNEKSGDSYIANNDACESWRETACGSDTLGRSNYDGNCPCDPDCAPDWWEG